MSRRSRNDTKDRPRGAIARRVPWTALLQGGAVVGRRVATLSEKDRTRLIVLLRESRGWPGRLDPRERAELRRLLAKLDLAAIGRELAALRAVTRARQLRR
jgi:hypothetical protein